MYVTDVQCSMNWITAHGENVVSVSDTCAYSVNEIITIILGVLMFS